ncbi:holdfast anchoring protein HfaA [Hyphobacterium sp. SN044]|uniref:holdfast anchoring protein HfaA n=1 Tax=Hyphobacterium sp. SN044 TaxID=2912575 RepID=UPI001F247FA0|nr:holdfast anchoring protein HfaA [Hyphobacterium sp. SN044]MCF8878584.1 holdfast anchoring protein HfaA [Hyphobacterium sp. SN044]
MAPRKTALMLFAAIGALSTAPALAQSASDYQRPWGTSPGQTSQPYRAGTRDQNNNRVVVNGVMQTGVGVQAAGQGTGGVGQSSSTGNQYSSATAIGNQLNVVVNGNWNTVVVNSTQTNNGNVTATSGTGGNDDREPQWEYNPNER